MASSGIFELTALGSGAVQLDDVLCIVDVHDPTQSAQGTTKKITLTNLFTTAATPVTVSSPVVNVTQAWNAGAVAFTAIKANVTDTASAAGSLLIDLQVASVSKFSVSKAGVLTTVTVVANLTGNVTGNVTGALTGNASTATSAATLTTPRAINGVAFDGSAAITITAAAGTLTGATLASNVLASSLTSVGVLASPHVTTLTVDSGGLTVTAGTVSVPSLIVFSTAAAFSNTPGSFQRTTTSGMLIQASTGATFDFQLLNAAATLNIVAVPVGTNNLTAGGSLTVATGVTVSANGIAVTGNSTITGTLGGITTLTATTVIAALTGNASTATALQTARAINGVNFDGSAGITVTAAAGTLTGATLASNVLASSLTSVGVLASPHVTTLTVDSGGAVITAGTLVVTAGDVQVTTGRHYNFEGTISVPNTTLTTVLTLPAGNNFTFLVTAKTTGAGFGNFAQAYIGSGNTGTYATAFAASVAGAITAMSVTAGGAVQVNQNSGGATNITVTAIRLA